MKLIIESVLTVVDDSILIYALYDIMHYMSQKVAMVSLIIKVQLVRLHYLIQFIYSIK